jgi:hypothetical protein
MLNISPRLLKRASISFALVTTMGIGMAVAQTTSPDPAMTNPSSSETNTMDRYLNSNPRIAQQLHNDPSLINNPQWLADHPKVQSYMNSHPSMKNDAANNPAGFVNHTERHDLNADHKALNGTDNFMRDHPKVAQELKSDPKLIDDPKYLADHPGLDDYLAKHPAVRREAMAHPDGFAKAAEANNRYEKTHEIPPPAKRK